MRKSSPASGRRGILARRPEVLEGEADHHGHCAGRARRTFVCDVAKADEHQKTYDGGHQAFGKGSNPDQQRRQSMAMPSEQINRDIWRDDWN